jgi:hypothetical protein
VFIAIKAQIEPMKGHDISLVASGEIPALSVVNVRKPGSACSQFHE